MVKFNRNLTRYNYFVRLQ